MREGMRARWAGMCLAGVAAGIAGVFTVAMPTAAGPPDARRATYVGHENYSGSPRAKVRLELRESARGKPRGEFKAKNVLLYCDDGTHPTRALPPLHVDPGGDGMVGSKYVLMVDGFQSYYRVEVRFVRHGAVARGSIIYLETPLDPAGAPQRPDCFTGEPLHWKARRVGG
jgi:hypothetical protein